LEDRVIERLRQAASSNLADAMGRFGFMDPGITSRTGRRLCGTAVTVQCRPGDNLMVHKALEVAAPGEIVVATTCGNTTNAIFGELMAHAAVARRLGGIVVDGAIRDVSGISALELPAFSRSVCAGSCDKDGPGEVNVPIACGGVVVMPGDVVVGDDDGVVIVPRGAVRQVLENLDGLVERERKRVAEIRAGVVSKPDVDETLRRHGVIT
jgi:regulator of RNase E activity RraA